MERQDKSRRFASCTRMSWRRDIWITIATRHFVRPSQRGTQRPILEQPNPAVTSMKQRSLSSRCWDMTFYGFAGWRRDMSVFWCLCLRRRLRKTKTNRPTARNSMTVKVLATVGVSVFICRNRTSIATATTSITKLILRTRFSRASNEGCEEFTETHLCCFDWNLVLRPTTCPCQLV